MLSHCFCYYDQLNCTSFIQQLEILALKNTKLLK